MATPKRTSPTLVLDPVQADNTLETLTEAEAIDASLCLVCSEPLAWHETACQNITAPATEGPFEEPKAASATFAYALGQPVQLAPDAPPCPIIWRGQVKERHPRSGLIHRVNVYRLKNQYWDCYYEAELQAAHGAKSLP